MTDSSEDIRGSLQCPAFYKCTSQSSDVLGGARDDRSSPFLQRSRRASAQNTTGHQRRPCRTDSVPSGPSRLQPSRTSPKPPKRPRHRPRRMVDLVPLLCTGLQPWPLQVPSQSFPRPPNGRACPVSSQSFTASGPLHGRVASPLTSGPALPQFDEPYDPLGAPPDPQDQILSQQTAALNALVSHLVQGGGEGLGVDYHGGGAASSSTKRHRKKGEAAARSCGQAVNLFPGFATADLPEASSIYRDPTDGGGGGKKGTLFADPPTKVWWVQGAERSGADDAHALDSAASGDVYATKEYLALGVMALEQSAFDAGDWGLAYVLPLIEDPPQVLFQDRAQSITSAGRPFAPLIPPQLATINLAYLKEIDLLQTRRMEMKGKKNQSAVPKSQEESPSPRRKPKFPRKPGEAQQ